MDEWVKVMDTVIDSVEMAPDQKIAGVYRVEAFDDDGGCEVAIFCGPRAKDRAVVFGRSFYGRDLSGNASLDT